MRADQPVETIVSGRIIRADGSVEELGVLAYAHRNPVKDLLGRRKVRGGGILAAIRGRIGRVR